MRLGAAVALVCLLGAPIALAAPEDTRVDAVYQVDDDCVGKSCPTADDGQVGPGSAVGGGIQVHVGTRSTAPGIEWVRLEAQVEGDQRWVCVQQWNPGRPVDFTGHHNWNTVAWPKPGHLEGGESDWGCDETVPHFHGEPTTNGTYTLRARARELGTDEEQTSAGFPIVLDNPPAPPAWVSAPKASRHDGRPSVTLRWKANRERDVTEYHVVRIGPDGAETEFAISASDPGAQGCAKIGEDAYTCDDRGFTASGDGGTYRYALLAYRPGARAGERCALTRAACRESQPSAVQRVDLDGWAANESGRTSSGGSTRRSGTDAGTDPTQSAEPGDEGPVSTPELAAGPVTVEPPRSRAQQIDDAEAAASRGPLVAGALLALSLGGAAAGYQSVRRRRLAGIPDAALNQTQEAEHIDIDEDERV